MSTRTKKILGLLLAIALVIAIVVAPTKMGDIVVGLWDLIYRAAESFVQFVKTILNRT